MTENSTIDSDSRTGHSRMGITSFVIAILATVVIVALVIVAGTLTAQALQGIDGQNVNPQELQERLQDSPAVTSLALASIGIFACFFLYLLGLGLGIAGIVQGQRKRIFSVLGTIFNGGVLLVLVVLILLGLVAGGI
ncbi:MAG: hypothetical protein WA982_17115 [Rubrobacteraceae bacterium]